MTDPSRRGFLRLAAGAGAAGLLTSCGVSRGSNSGREAGLPAPRSAAPLGQPATIRLVHHRPPFDITPVLFLPEIREPVVMPDYGLIYQVQPILVDDSAAGLRLLLSGDGDLVSTDPLTLARTAGGMEPVDLKIITTIAGDGIGYFRSDVFRVMADSGITQAEDLEGRRVSGGPAGGILDLALKSWLMDGGLDPGDDVELVPLPFDEVGDALRNRSIQLAPFVPPFDAFEAVRGGMMNLFFRRDVFGASEALLQVSDSVWLADHRLAARTFQADRLRALEYVLNDGRELALELMAEEYGVQLAASNLYFATLRDNFRALDGCLRLDRLQPSLDKFRTLGGIDDPFDASDFVDVAFVPGPCPL